MSVKTGGAAIRRRLALADQFEFCERGRAAGEETAREMNALLPLLDLALYPVPLPMKLSDDLARGVKQSSSGRDRNLISSLADHWPVRCRSANPSCELGQPSKNDQQLRRS